MTREKKALIQSWMKKMTIQERVLFKENISGTFAKYCETDWHNFQMFLNCAFDWSETPQGFDFWHEIYER